ncbi:thiol-disulfide oxidoreductase LTO1-like [Coffea arabica]|uniref:Thiol-disulfide oxidoreductase LTO1-like n=1 Tax=Coffea arabica TaxID=13443 RepID=A0A6P6T5L1_COFAR|nr:thiol-disulfide oxidoreductase LTO1-like [Coffea arabica]
MAKAASFVSSLSASPVFFQAPLLSPSPPHSISTHVLHQSKVPALSRSLSLSLKYLTCNHRMKSGCARRLSLLRVNCLPEQTTREAEENSEAKTPTSASASTSTSSSYSSDNESAVTALNWVAGLGGLGFLETSYLTYLKLTDSDAFCPVGGGGGGGGCGSVLNSDYSVVFGVPLPLIGMFAYGAVATLGLQLGSKKLPFGIGETDACSVLLVTTTSMAVASAYFLYILTTKFSGESCLYCLTSAFLSFCLFFITLKDFGLKELQKEVVLQLCVAVLVVITLNSSYNALQPVSTSLAEVDLPLVKTEVTTKSSPLAVSLARHLHAIGAKMYGAFWCSHCLEQKEMFGHEASDILDYVECFPNGYRKGTIMAKACTDVKIEGFPTWVINGEVLSGELDFSELAKASGIKLEDLSQAN